jgi:rhodanese-related sulfurtransferase
MRLIELNGLRIALNVLAIIGLLSGERAIAQMTIGDKLPEALTKIKQATGACRRDDLLANMSGALASQEDQTDIGCAVTVGSMEFLLQKPHTALIDLRSATEYQAFHIQKALNLSMDELHSKPYWRDKTVVLIGRGKAERELYSACYRLKHSGYKQVRVLQGGMLQWLVQNQPVTGRAPPSVLLAKLSSAEFWVESRSPENVVILDKEQGALQADLPFSVVVQKTTGDAIKTILERRRKETKNAPLAAVVLAADPTITDQKIQQLQQALTPVPLLLYAETREAFVRQIATQKAIWAALARGPRQPGCGL